jgi:hypothetical protein
VKQVSYKRHKFDELMKLATLTILIVFATVLVLVKSSLAHDVTLIVVGLIGGKGLKSIN